MSLLFLQSPGKRRRTKKKNEEASFRRPFQRLTSSTVQLGKLDIVSPSLLSVVCFYPFFLSSVLRSRGVWVKEVLPFLRSRRSVDDC